jgi:hypothetical protein
MSPETVGTTVITFVIKHVGEVRYVIVVVPDVTPVRIPEDDSMVALVGLLLVHVPPAGELERVRTQVLHT